MKGAVITTVDKVGNRDKYFDPNGEDPDCNFTTVEELIAEADLWKRLEALSDDTISDLCKKAGKKFIYEKRGKVFMPDGTIKEIKK